MAAAMSGACRAVASRCISFSPIAVSATSRLFPSSSSPVRALGRLSRRKLPLGIARSPVELGGPQSLMPFHSATSTALLTSMLSTRPGGWSWLSEGLATPL
ncbi:protein NUCLEAR FUSION DEFECTIVE 6, chloroplastic/mitochondrial-like [Canna indica]|uniref:Protein NUCLEAR FUSION DEFECTIVE 6, chloroplastic/mitochondrial-like n=1 Tax=Canna indica TaxID=4628 RepID=A0AAQ3KPW9_9LILI|nr:protein NUCLEAR FUSION DEFECTIVE 6, chloroplastic/mitochondrial-like [Canna indica]